MMANGVLIIILERFCPSEEHREQELNVTSCINQTWKNIDTNRFQLLRLRYVYRKGLLTFDLLTFEV